MEFPIIITESDYNKYLTKKNQFQLNVIVSVIKGFKEMERDV